MNKICNDCIFFGEYIEYNLAICSKTGELKHRIQPCDCKFNIDTLEAIKNSNTIICTDAEDMFNKLDI